MLDRTDLGTHVRKEKDHAIIGLQDFPFLLPQGREGLTKPEDAGIRNETNPQLGTDEMMSSGLMSIGGDYLERNQEIQTMQLHTPMPSMYGLFTYI